MPDCCDRHDYDREFDPELASRKLAAYRRDGPSRPTRLLIDALLSQGVEGLTVLDIGAGVGAIHHGLLEAGAGRATDVDASAAYIAAAGEEARRLGHADRVHYRYGDFTELAGEIDPADIVALDRVICCYPDMPRLVGLSTDRARRLYGLVYPPDVWWMRLGARVINAFRRFSKSTQFYVHPEAAIDQAVRQAGFEPRFKARTLMWQVVVYARAVVLPPIPSAGR